MTVFLGDVHGKYGAYKTLMKKYPNSVQLGDMGVGFRRQAGWRAGEFFTNPPHDHMVKYNARFIRGNHDNPATCRNHKQCISDGTYEDGKFFVGGAFSIDRAWRTEGYDWWPEEELEQSEFYKIMDIYENVKPRVMVTHDCPEDVIPYIHSHHLGITTKTGQAFNAFWHLHQPEVWVFGHHHKWFDQVLNGTRFICVPELETKEIE